jgi:hypothetical protein
MGPFFVARKFFVPANAPFARSLEIIENPTDDVLSTEVMLTSHMALIPNPREIESSSGDGRATERDGYVLADDVDGALP